MKKRTDKPAKKDRVWFERKVAELKTELEKLPAEAARAGPQAREAVITGQSSWDPNIYRPGMAGRQRGSRASTAVKTNATTKAGTPVMSGQSNNAMHNRYRLPVPVSNE